MNTWGLNLLYAEPHVGGAWTYINRILCALANWDTTNRYILYVLDHVQLPKVPEGATVIRLRLPRSGPAKAYRVLAEHMYVPRLAREHGCDALHWFGGIGGLSVKGLPSVVTVHDLKPFEQKNYSPRDIYFRRCFPVTARYADYLTVISNSTEVTLRRHFPTAARKVGVLPVPIPRRFRPASPSSLTGFLAERNLPNPYWLYVAHFYPHKNHIRLLRAYKQYADSVPTPSPLVLCGARPPRSLVEATRELRIGPNVIWLDNLHDEEMPLLYSGAKALVFPSLYEGCGMPVLEALSCSCPVLASDIPTTREFADGAAITFDPLNVDQIADRLISASNSARLRELSGRAHLIAARHSEESVAGKLLDIYLRLSGQPQALTA